jgi:hypothetical protein
MRYPQVWKTKGLSTTDGFRKQNASETLALLGQVAMISGNNYTSGVMDCQVKKDGAGIADHVWAVEEVVDLLDTVKVQNAA